VIVVFDSVSSAFHTVAHRNPYIADPSCSKNAVRNCFVEVHLNTIGVQTPVTLPRDDDPSTENHEAIFVDTLERVGLDAHRLASIAIAHMGMPAGSRVIQIDRHRNRGNGSTTGNEKECQ